MKALSVRQPWAWLLFHGKDVENRDWFTAYRGPLVILASKQMPLSEYREAVQFVARFDSWLADRIPPPSELVFGAALGTVEQCGCVRFSDSPWFQGAFGHLYRNAKLFEQPVPAVGRLGLFEWEPSLGEGLAVDERHGGLFAGSDV